MKAPEQEPDCPSADRVLCLMGCFFLALFVIVLTFYIVCPDQKCPVIIDSGSNQ
jgi:hypothetical protein